MENVRLVEDSMAILSLRDSDFDAYSAYGEVIDNSIQAEAEWVKISLDVEATKTRGKKKAYSAIKEIAFGDNGEGMPSEILHRCMQLGYSSRYNDRSGIGRFGVGMTLAAINQCKRVEIYSKEKGNEWFYTYIDLAEITGDPPKQTEIPRPVKKNPPEKYSSIIDKEKGTLVIWKKYDRQPESADKMLPGMQRWFGRTYRKFICENDFSIYLDGVEVFAVDPLYVKKEKTEFPNDPPATLYEPFCFKWPVSKLDKVSGAPEKSEIVIRLSKLNGFHYPRQGSGQSAENTARGIHEVKGPGNEGISILRNRREVFYGHIPYWPKKAFSDIDRWWGCEISFDAVLDRAFTVKNIKRGAIPVKELKEHIADQIEPTRRQVIEDVREYWAEAKKEEDRKKKDDDDVKTGHDEVEKIVSKTTTDKSGIDKNKEVTEEAKKLVDELMGDKNEEEKAKWVAKFASQPFTIMEDRWRGPVFLEARHLGGKDVLKYNLQHPFFTIIYSIIENIEKSSDDAQSSQDLKELIDILLIAYSKAEAKFDAQEQMTWEDFGEYLRTNWGMYLQNYTKTWKKEKGYE